MEVVIKRIDETLPLPEYQTPGSVAFDLYSRIDMTITPKSVGLIPTNVIIRTPPGYMLVVASRSSLPKKKGLSMPHGIGIIDQDYCGEQDEILLQVYNFTEQDAIIEKGVRLGQATFIPIERVTWKEVSHMQEKSRGGVGSTGS